MTPKAKQQELAEVMTSYAALADQAFTAPESADTFAFRDKVRAQYNDAKLAYEQHCWRFALQAYAFPCDLLPKETNVNEKEHLDLALAVAAECESHDPKLKTAGPFRSKLGDVMKWLRTQGVPWPKILALIGPLMAAFTTGDWAALIAAVIALFNLPPNTPIPTL